MTLFFAGLSLGLLLHRQGHKPLLRFPVRCWFGGHIPNKTTAQCDRCHLWGIEDAFERWNNTFWTA